MYEVYDAKTGELKRVDLYHLEKGLADGSLLSQKPTEKKTPTKKVNADENKG